MLEKDLVEVETEEGERVQVKTILDYDKRCSIVNLPLYYFVILIIHIYLFFRDIWCRAMMAISM